MSWFLLGFAVINFIIVTIAFIVALRAALAAKRGK